MGIMKSRTEDEPGGNGVNPDPPWGLTRWPGRGEGEDGPLASSVGQGAGMAALTSGQGGQVTMLLLSLFVR